MLGAGDEPAVKNVPVPQFTVAPQVNLARANAADGHPDLFEFRTAIYGRLAALGEGLEPFRAQLLVGGNQLLEVGACEGAGHRLPGFKSERGRAEANRLEKITTAEAERSHRLVATAARACAFYFRVHRFRCWARRLASSRRLVVLGAGSPSGPDGPGAATGGRSGAIGSGSPAGGGTEGAPSGLN